MALRWYYLLLFLIAVALVGCEAPKDPTPSPTAARPPALESSPARVAGPTPAPTPLALLTPTVMLTPSPAPTATFMPTLAPAPVSTREDARLIHLPQDEAPHGVPVEWWYFNGHLSDSDDGHYSFHFVGFHVNDVQVIQPLKGLDTRVLHFTLATPDGSGGVKAERMALGLGERPTEGFAVTAGGWSMEGVNGRFSLEASEGEYGLSLEMERTKPPTLHGGDGIVGMGPAGESYYYSRTRLKARGTITTGGVPREVTGEAWMDQQWGDFGREPVGWDWFSLQLDDNTEVMAFLLWDFDTGELLRKAGTYISPDGAPHYLHGEDIEVTARDSWTSPRTKIEYPVGWQLRIVPVSLSVEIEPVHMDAEFDVSKLGAPVYWEGAVTFSGQRDGQPVDGRGFAELVGYDKRDQQDEAGPEPRPSAVP